MNDYLDFLLKLLPQILNFFKGNNFIWAYFCYTIGFILTTFALILVTNCLKDNKLSTVVFAFGVKLALFIFIKILEDSLTH